MGDALKDSTTKAVELEKVLAKKAVTIGVVEKATIKWTRKMYETPIIKQVLQITQLTTSLTNAIQVVKLRRDGEEEAADEMSKGTTIMMQMVAATMSYGVAMKIAEKGTTKLGKGMFALVGYITFLVGIFLLITLAGLALAAVFSDVNSPLAEWLTSIPVVGELFNGLKIILTGEDGESGLYGAVGVLAVALAAAGIAFILFGGPAAIVVGVVVLVVGIFRWLKAKTGSLVIALLGAGAVLALAIGIGLMFVKGATAAFYASIMIPVALLLAGLALAWAVATGKVSGWWSILVAALIAVGVYLLAGVLGFGLIITLPVAIVIGVAIALIAVIYRYWDEIYAFLVAIGNWFVGVKDSIVAGFWDFIGWIGDGLDSIGTMLSGWGDYIGDVVSGIVDYVVDVWDDFWADVDAIGTSVSNGWDRFMGWISKKITGLINGIRGWGNTIKSSVSGMFVVIGKGVIGFYNKWIAHIIPKFTVPEWSPVLAGESWGPAPKKIKLFADGGVVNKATLGVFGEAGPEAIIPLRGGNVPVKLSGQQYSDATIRQMVSHLSDILKKSGNTFNINIDVSGIIADSDKAKEKLAKEISDVIADRFRKSAPSWVPASSKRSGSWLF